MDRPFGKRFATRSVVMARQGMVASSQPLATQIGVDLLKRGGSAVDAAIGVNAALGLMEPTGAGIGGDLFAIVWDQTAASLQGLNGSGRSPASLTRDYFLAEGLGEIPAYGALSVSVPGAVDAWCELNARFGRLPLAEILAPSIAYARDGFPVSEIIAGYWAEDTAKLKQYAGFAEVFMPRDRAPAAGETFRNPALAEAYELIAVGGRDAFYQGPIAESVERVVRGAGGFLGQEDLAAHRSDWIEPVSANYRGYDVWQLPPNGQGIAVLQMLNILEGFDLGELEWGSAKHLHLLLEAKKLAFEDRARFYADPAFADVPVAQLISKSYADRRRRSIDAGRASLVPEPGDPRALTAGDTVYMAAADSEGNMVSLIQSNYRGMGSGIVLPEFGFMLQNRGASFALDADHANVYVPGKRPFHTIIPGFLTKDGGPVMAFGVMGASMQPQGQVQVLSNIIDFGMNLQEAGDAPRIRHEGSSEPTGTKIADGGVVHLESRISAEALAGLEALGHKVVPADDGFGGYQAIRWDAALRTYLGASESRKDGCAAGY